MIVKEFAADSGAANVVELLIFPAMLFTVGVVLLVAGLRRRSARRLPAGEPRFTTDSAESGSGRPALTAGPTPKPRRPSAGIAFVAVGAVLMVSGVLLSLGSLADSGETTESGRPSLSTGGVSPPSSPDPCSFATASEIKQALGYEVEKGQRTAVGTGCLYEAVTDPRGSGRTPDIFIFYRRADLDHAAKVDCLGNQRTPVSGLGIEGFDCGLALFVRLDQEHGFEVDLGNKLDAKWLDTRMAVARLVAPRISVVLLPH
ncbi:hypothetical protein [Mycobacterium attenuatum]|uniref:hypothetical protein n=1 Tax=Mycobacterium attenuatum TaxID=2341086 RepID=UPI000F142CC2|nr:hypothetical protein [Mycobacterium attenuatum]VBA61746.1 hypothetical protein LAUMK41_05128 [Mycobacterium attenuatum]